MKSKRSKPQECNEQRPGIRFCTMLALCAALLYAMIQQLPSESSPFSPSGNLTIHIRKLGSAAVALSVPRSMIQVREPHRLVLLANAALRYPRGSRLTWLDGAAVTRESLEKIAEGDQLVLLQQDELFMYTPRAEPYPIELPSEQRTVQLKTLSNQPRLFLIDDFLVGDEAEQIMELARPSLQRAGVAFFEDARDDQDALAQAQSVRTSSNTFLQIGMQNDEGLLADVERRVGELLRLSQNTASSSQYMEHLQVVHYAPHQHYDAHRDYFPKEMYPSNQQLQEGNNRLATVFFYLNDNSTSPPILGGGETWFPRADGLPMINEYNSCKGGIKVSPKRNSAVLFYSLKAGGHMPRDGGDVDDFSWHGACHVLKGEKWGANKWVWNSRRQF